MKVDGEILVIDPYFTRAPLRNVFIGRVTPDVYNNRYHPPSYDYVLITHPHFDHVMDAGEILRHSRAQGYGSPNACQLMGFMGAPQENLHVISSGDHLEIGPFSVDVYVLEHRVTPVDHWINGDLPQKLKAPPRLLDYRMDKCFGFHIQVDGLGVLVGDLPFEAHVLFTIPLNTKDYYEQLLDHIRPKLVIPIHWDDFFRPLTKLGPMYTPPKFAWPPMQRLNLGDFKQDIETITNDYHDYQVLIPKVFNAYDLFTEIN